MPHAPPRAPSHGAPSAPRALPPAWLRPALWLWQNRSQTLLSPGRPLLPGQPRRGGHLPAHPPPDGRARRTRAGSVRWQRSCSLGSSHPLPQDGCGLVLVIVDHLLETLERRPPELLCEIRDEVGLRGAYGGRRSGGHRLRKRLRLRLERLGGLGLPSGGVEYGLRRGPQPEPDQQRGYADDGERVDDAAQLTEQLLDDARGADRLQRLAALQELDRRHGYSVAALLVDASRGADQAFYLLQLLVDGLGAGPLAQRGQQALPVYHHGDRQLLDLVALADGRGGLGADLVVRQLLAPLVGALRLVARRGGGLLGRNVLLDADGVAGVAVLLVARLLDDAHRSLDAGIGIECRLVDLPLVRVEARGDADLEIVEPQIGRERLGDVVLQLAADGLLERDHLGRRGARRVAAGSQDRAVGAQERHLIDGHAGHGGRHEVANGRSGGEVVGRFGADDDRRRRRLAIAPE